MMVAERSFFGTCGCEWYCISQILHICIFVWLLLMMVAEQSFFDTCGFSFLWMILYLSNINIFSFYIFFALVCIVYFSRCCCWWWRSRASLALVVFGSTAVSLCPSLHHQSFSINGAFFHLFLMYGAYHCLTAKDIPWKFINFSSF